MLGFQVISLGRNAELFLFITYFSLGQKLCHNAAVGGRSVVAPPAVDVVEMVAPNLISMPSIPGASAPRASLGVGVISC